MTDKWLKEQWLVAPALAERAQGQMSLQWTAVRRSDGKKFGLEHTLKDQDPDTETKARSALRSIIDKVPG